MTKISEAALLASLLATDRVPAQRDVNDNAFLLSTLLTWLKADPQRLVSRGAGLADGQLTKYDPGDLQLISGEPSASDTVDYLRRHKVDGTLAWVSGLSTSLSSVLLATVGIGLTAETIDTSTLGGTWVPAVSAGMLKRFTGTTAVTINAMAAGETGVVLLRVPPGSNITLNGYETAGTGPRSPDGDQYLSFINFGGGGLFAIWSHGVP